MSLIAILILGAVLGIAWRLVRLAVRVALLIALIAAIANYGSHLTQHNHPPPAPPARHAR
jgi:disulfide bond formation protein DsbB